LLKLLLFYKKQLLFTTITQQRYNIKFNLANNIFILTIIIFILNIINYYCFLYQLWNRILYLLYFRHSDTL